MSSSTDNDAEKLTLQIEGLSIENDVGVKIVICAACGKEGEEVGMNICNKCKMVHYCNVTCKKKHKSKHKKKCERRATELHYEALFNEPPPRKECPICFLPLPLVRAESTFYSCCGTDICLGCIYVMLSEDIKKGKELEEHLCAFCRTPETSSDEEYVKRIKRLMENGNASAFNALAGCYARGTNGMQQDKVKANELWLKAGELGRAVGYCKLGGSYSIGTGVERDEKKSKHYLELAAMGGDVDARHILGCMEGAASNNHRALKHFIIAASAGNQKSLDKVMQGFMYGLATKDEYENALRAHQERQDEMKSDARVVASREIVHSVKH